MVKSKNTKQISTNRESIGIYIKDIYKIYVSINMNIRRDGHGTHIKFDCGGSWRTNGTKMYLVGDVIAKARKINRFFKS